MMFTIQVLRAMTIITSENGSDSIGYLTIADPERELRFYSYRFLLPGSDWRLKLLKMITDEVDAAVGG